MKVPFSMPPDAPTDAGLRDYRAPLTPSREWPPDDGSVSAWYRYALFVAILTIVALLVFILSGGAW